MLVNKKEAMAGHSGLAFALACSPVVFCPRPLPVCCGGVDLTTPWAVGLAPGPIFGDDAIRPDLGIHLFTDYLLLLSGFGVAADVDDRQLCWPRPDVSVFDIRSPVMMPIQALIEEVQKLPC